jgi:hypothetical protein
MTNDEKFNAIIDRMKSFGIDLDPSHVSAMVIIGYLTNLTELGLIQTEFKITPLGKNVQSICEEFDWKPSNDDIKAFVMEMAEDTDRAPMMFMILKYRDDREGLIEEVKKFKKNNPE